MTSPIDAETISARTVAILAPVAHLIVNEDKTFRDLATHGRDLQREEHSKKKGDFFGVEAFHALEALRLCCARVHAARRSASALDKGLWGAAYAALDKAEIEYSIAARRGAFPVADYAKIEIFGGGIPLSRWGKEEGASAS